jgi:hypothetical protein
MKVGPDIERITNKASVVSGVDPVTFIRGVRANDAVASQ